MDINSENLNTLFFSFNALLQKGLAQAWNEWEKYTTTINSATALEKYPMTIIAGGMREWVGPRFINAVGGKLLEVRNRDFEMTQGVSRNDIEDDNIGFYSALFTEMGINAGSLWPRLSVEALCNAGKWADGGDFFAASRKIGKATINNVVAGELSTSNYETARSQMMGFMQADGKTPIGLVPDTLMVGPSNEKTARQILKADLVAEGGAAVTNVHRDEAEIIVNPYLVGSDAGKWFLMCTRRGIKPVAVQKRKVGPLVRWDKDSDPCVKDENRCDYGVHYRGAAVAVAPQLVVGGNL